MRKFMRTRGAAPQPHAHAHKTNGHANGAAGAAGARRDDRGSQGRYWSGSEEESALGAGAGAGAAGDAEGPLWEDPEFPAGGAALGDRRLAHAVVWLRPHEMCARPRFLGDEALESAPGAAPPPEPDDHAAARWRVEAGGASWAGGAGVGGGAGGAGAGLRVAAAALSLTPRLLARVVPPQSFRVHYTGAFRFQFWVFGAWREVAVDDRLPAPHAARAALPDDFTLPLLEKAYAKLYGSYAAARGAGGAGGAGGADGVARALQELTGGVVQSFAPPRQPRALLLQVLHSAVPRSTLLVATVAPGKDGGSRRLRNGLIPEQAYCVTGLARVRGPGAGAGLAAGEACEEGEDEGGEAGALVRLRAPSGRGEWAGAWARGSPEWRALAPHDRDLLARRAAQPGHFWMSFSEFARAFGRLELVHVGPDDWLREPALHGKRPWRAVLARRRWRAGYNAGGPPGAPTAHTNPRFHLAVPRAAAPGAGKCHVVVSVTQRYAVGRAHPPAPRLRSIGFAVYALPHAHAPRRAALQPDLNDLRALDVTHECRAREVVTFFTLPPGQYLVVPHTRRAHTDAAFLLRILTDDHTDVWEVNDDNVIIRDIAKEFEDEGRVLPPHLNAVVTKVLEKLGDEELDAEALRAVLRRAGGCCGRLWGGRGAWGGSGGAGGAPSLELCRALVALRDPGVSGRVAARRVPALLAALAAWRAAWARGPRSPYALRGLLWACGLAASNKVLECVVVRFARRAALSAEGFLLALARLHLAHERFRSLDTKLKSNPLSLEEMILMTIYS